MQDYRQLTQQSKRESEKAHSKHKEVREIEGKMKKLAKELSKLHSDRISGVVMGRVNPREILKKERRMHDIHKEQETLKRKVRSYKKEVDYHERSSRELVRLADKAKGGEKSAFRRAQSLSYESSHRHI